MTDEAAFLAAVLADPDDDAPRLIYADWLDEQGQYERAEFIRVQMELAGLPERIPPTWKNGGCSICGYPGVGEASHYHCLECGVMCGMMGCGKEACQESYRRRAALKLRSRELLDAACVANAPWTDVWPWPRSSPDARWEFRRGFVEFITCTAADWMAHGDDVLKAQPVRRVELTTIPVVPGAGNERMDPYLHGRVMAVLEKRWPGIGFVLTALARMTGVDIPVVGY